MVNCAGCTECCKGFDPVFLLPYEAGYEEQTYEGRRALQHKMNGECVYLNEDGCSIYERRPAVCRGYDCTEIVPRAIPFGSVRQSLIDAMERARLR